MHVLRSKVQFNFISGDRVCFSYKHYATQVNSGSVMITEFSPGKCFTIHYYGESNCQPKLDIRSTKQYNRDALNSNDLLTPGESVKKKFIEVITKRELVSSMRDFATNLQAHNLVSKIKNEILRAS